MIDLSYMIWDMKTEERRNRFTGQREFLTKEEADIHDSVFVHEALEQWTEMQKALDKFSRLNPGCARGIEVPGPSPLLKFFKKPFSFFTKRGPRAKTLC